MRINKKNKRVAVGMSGGTDSSAVAAMLVDQGFDVIGLTAHMWKEGSRCCSLEDVERARSVCDFLVIMQELSNILTVYFVCSVQKILKKINHIFYIVLISINWNV